MDLTYQDFVEYQINYSQWCPKNHKLTWSNNHISQCGVCGNPPKSNSSRYKCQDCKVSYCVSCCIPPTNGVICGGGHEMKLTNVPHHVCDICRNTINSFAYRCAKCDFDVCFSCKLVKED